MRGFTVVPALAALPLLVLLLSGCLGNQDEPTTPGDLTDTPAPGPAPVPFDNLSKRLDPGSGEAQVFDVEEDAFVLPGGGRMAFHTGRGMHCVGDADPVAPNATGWVACMVRLGAEPSAMAQDVHALGIGLDAQRLSLRMAAEAVEWRLVVSIAADTSSGATGTGPLAIVAFDSGWRRVDLSPVIDRPSVEVVVEDPCDAAAVTEDPEAPSGRAVLYVNFTASHGAPFISVDLAASKPRAAKSDPFAGHGTGEHTFMALHEPFGLLQRGSLELRVDLEAPETPTEATPGGACTLIVARDLQEWNVDVGIVGADGRQEMRQRTLTVEVLLEAAAT